MHVLIVVLHRPDKPTGVCRHAANLAKCLAETDKVTKITLVTGAWQQHYFETAFSLNSEKIEVLDIRIKNSSLSRNIWFLFGLPKLVKKLQPDLVHLSFPLPFLRSQFSCPVVSTIHDLYPYECPENFGYVQSFFNRWFLKQCVQESDGLTCVSQVTLERLKEFFLETVLKKKLAVIYNYVDFKDVSAKIPKDLKDIAETPFLLCVAQHRKNKNLDLLIKAYHLLLGDLRLDSTTKLVIVGSSGPETENLHDLIQTYNLCDRVLLMSSVEDAELCWLYQNCQLFVIPSSTEGFCIPLVEALNFSTKVVCSDIPIFREIADSRCYYFDLAHEPMENLARVIVHALHQISSDIGLEEPRFSKTNVVEQYLKFYSKV
jgi:glycosyltransferase involved in cell wall biosynthesis